MVKRLTGRRSIPPALWAAWTTFNICACYAHYYSTLAFAAQALTLAILVARERSWPQLGWLRGESHGRRRGVPAVAADPVKTFSEPRAGMDVAQDAGVHLREHARRVARDVRRPRVGICLLPCLGYHRSSDDRHCGAWMLVIAFVGLGRRLRAASRPPAADALLLVAAITLAELLVASLVYQKNSSCRKRATHFVLPRDRCAVLRGSSRSCPPERPRHGAGPWSSRRPGPRWPSSSLSAAGMPSRPISGSSFPKRIQNPIERGQRSAAATAASAGRDGIRQFSRDRASAVLPARAVETVAGRRGDRVLGRDPEQHIHR